MRNASTSNTLRRGSLLKKQPSKFQSDLPFEDRIEGRLLDNSIHFLYGTIEDNNVAAAIKWITYENLDPRERVLTLYINSPGGDLYQAFALIDVIKASTIPIRTIAIGQAMSAAFLIFISGTRGYRLVGPNTGLMCHEYSDTPAGKHHDLKAQIAEGEQCNKRMFQIIQDATDLPPAKIRSNLLRESDVFLTAEQAIDLKIADRIIQRPTPT